MKITICRTSFVVQFFNSCDLWQDTAEPAAELVKGKENLAYMRRIDPDRRHRLVRRDIIDTVILEG